MRDGRVRKLPSTVDPKSEAFAANAKVNRALVEQLRARLSGLAMPTYMLDLPGGFGKVPLESHNVEKTQSGYRIRDTRGAWHDYIAG